MYRKKRSAYFLRLIALLLILGSVRAYGKNHLHDQRHADHIDHHINHDDYGVDDYDDDFEYDDYDQDLEDLHNHLAKEMRQEKGNRMRVPHYRAATSLYKRKWNPTPVKVVNQAPFQMFKRHGSHGNHANNFMKRHGSHRPFNNNRVSYMKRNVLFDPDYHKEYDYGYGDYSEPSLVDDANPGDYSLEDYINS